MVIRIDFSVIGLKIVLLNIYGWLENIKSRVNAVTTNYNLVVLGEQVGGFHLYDRFITLNHSVLLISADLDQKHSTRALCSA